VARPQAEYRAVTRPTLAVTAFRNDDAGDLDALLASLVSLRQTAPKLPVLLIEDLATGEPSLAAVAADELGCAYVPQDDGAGLSGAIAAGLEYARDAGLDAVLVGADVELVRPGWLEGMLERRDSAGRPAAVVGGRVDFAGGLVEQAGFFYSVIKRRWQPRFRGVPAEVPEIGVPTLCPVGGRLALVRHETLAVVGLPDATLQEPYAMIDYCLRVFEAGLECVYEPAAAGRAPRVAAGPPEETAGELRAHALLEQHHPAAALDRFIPDLV
jgi:GT2 family glycosyltransferase